MKTIMIFLPAIYLFIAVPDAQAGIASVITYLSGECEKEDENGVRFCSSRETGAIYYLYQGDRYKTYPLK